MPNPTIFAFPPRREICRKGRGLEAGDRLEAETGDIGCQRVAGRAVRNGQAERHERRLGTVPLRRRETLLFRESSAKVKSEH